MPEGFETSVFSPIDRVCPVARDCGNLDQLLTQPGGLRHRKRLIEFFHKDICPGQSSVIVVLIGQASSPVCKVLRSVKPGSVGVVLLSPLLDLPVQLVPGVVQDIVVVVQNQTPVACSSFTEITPPHRWQILTPISVP